MKRILLFIFAFGIFSINAQDLTSKKGENYLPEEGEWAIGFAANPFLDFAGNLFNSNASAPSYSEPMMAGTFYGKLFTSDDQAYRVTLGINMGSQKTSTLVPGWTLNQGDWEATDNLVEDVQKVSESSFALGLGKEFRRGSTRLQGVYGAEALFKLSSTTTKYEYGNSIQSPAYNLFDSRPIDVKSGSTLEFGVRAFIGAEYFIAPKISISAEYGWGLHLTSKAGGSTTSETLELDNNDNFISSSSSVDDVSGPNSFTIGNDLGFDLGSASLGLMLHF